MSSTFPVSFYLFFYTNNTEYLQVSSSAAGTGDGSFAYRHIGPRRDDRNAMLHFIGCKNLKEMIEKTIPEEIILKRDLDLPEAVDERRMLEVQLK